MDGQHWVEKVGEPDPGGLRNQPEKGPVAIKGPGTALLHNGEGRLAIPEKKLVPEPSQRVLVGQLGHGGAMHLEIDDRDQAVGQDAPDHHAGREVFEPCHELLPYAPAAILRQIPREVHPGRGGAGWAQRQHPTSRTWPTLCTRCS